MIASPLQQTRPAPEDRQAIRSREASASAPRARPAGRRGLAAAALVLAVASAAGCSSGQSDRSGLFQPYRSDLPQGNYVTREMLDRVTPGMTRTQVRAALGTPLLEPMFRDNRWDYVFRYVHASGRSEKRHVTIFFSDDKVASIQADELPLREDPTDPALPGARTRAR
jgi:outer membrane protein assembly factor BamE